MLTKTAMLMNTIKLIADEYDIVIDWENTNIADRCINFLSDVDEDTAMEFLSKVVPILERGVLDGEVEEVGTCQCDSCTCDDGGGDCGGGCH